MADPDHISEDLRSQPLRATTLKVLTWNLWWRFGAHWRRRQPLILQTLQALDADVIALQEVWRDGEAGQADALADALGFEFAFDVVKRIDGMDFGNAVLCRWPIATHRARALPTAPSEDFARRALAARIDGPRGTLTAVSTHLSWRPHESRARREQVRAVCELVQETAAADFPPLVCGDFNAVPTSDEVRAMTGESAVPVEGLFFYDAWAVGGDGGPGITWDNGNANTRGALEPDRRLDYVFVGRPLDDGAGNVLRAQLIGRDATADLHPSDHYGVLAELRY